MAWPEEVYQAVGTTWYLKWQSEAERNHKLRKTDGIDWFFWFIIRSVIYGYILSTIFHFMKRRVPAFFGYGPVRRDPNLQKLRRLVILCFFVSGLYMTIMVQSVEWVEWVELGFCFSLLPFSS